MRLFAMWLVLALTISACGTTTCTDSTSTKADIGDCSLYEVPPVPDAGPDGGVPDDFSDCQLRNDLRTAIGTRAPTSPEACTDLCSAATGVRRTYTLCQLARTPKDDPNGGTTGSQGTWYVSCEFTPAERNCGETKPDYVPTN